MKICSEENDEGCKIIHESIKTGYGDQPFHSLSLKDLLVLVSCRAELRCGVLICTAHLHIVSK